jgi:integrase/recombinase XerD
MAVLLDTGVRISEVLNARLDDLDLERQLLRVMGKGNKERIVPFGEKTAEWLEQYLAKRQKSVATDYLFVNQFGERLRRESVTQRFVAYGKKAGIEGVRVSPHTFRHTFGVTWLVGGGEFKGDTLSLQRILGHSTPAMTQKYVNFANEDLRKLHARLSPADRIMESPPEGKRRKLR